MLKTPLSTMIGGAGIWTPGCTVIGGQQNIDQLIKSMFANSEQGFAYDLNDLSTMYQDAAGTIPVTGVGQPVGLMLDKSRGAIRGTELWLDSTATFIGAASKVSPNVYRVYSPDASYSAVSTANTLIVGRYYEISLTIDSITVPGTGVAIEGFNDKNFNSVGVFRFILHATTTKLSIKRAGLACDIQVSNISLKELSGNHAYQTVSASRPILQRNATTGAYYLAFDGADDFLVTNNIDFTSTDKVSVFAGVRKLSDAASAIVAELSVTSDQNNGAFSLLAPGASGVNKFATVNRGTKLSFSVTTDSMYSAPYSAVLTVHNYIPLKTTLSVNHITFLDGLGAGTGNYGNYPLYIGRRAGTSLPFNGNLYSLIGIGRLTTDAETIALEKSIAKNTGVTLSV